jgi:hypothetical protein
MKDELAYYRARLGQQASSYDNYVHGSMANAQGDLQKLEGSVNTILTNSKRFIVIVFLPTYNLFHSPVVILQEEHEGGRWNCIYWTLDSGTPRRTFQLEPNSGINTYLRLWKVEGRVEFGTGSGWFSFGDTRLNVMYEYTTHVTFGDSSRVGRCAAHAVWTLKDFPRNHPDLNITLDPVVSVLYDILTLTINRIHTGRVGESESR